jgi:hypothetical protein
MRNLMLVFSICMILSVATAPATLAESRDDFRFNCRLLKPTSPWLWRQHCKALSAAAVEQPVSEPQDSDRKKPKKLHVLYKLRNVNRPTGAFGANSTSSGAGGSTESSSGAGGAISGVGGALGGLF